MSRNFKYAFISLLLVIFQATAMHFVSVEGITPDILAIWVVYVALNKGQLRGTIWGFAIGLSFDLVTGSFIGLAALTKTISGFVAGYFFNETKTKLILGSYRFLLVVLLVSFIQNALYFIVFTRGTEIGLFQAVLEFGLTTTFYTGTISLIPILTFFRQQSLT